MDLMNKAKKLALAFGAIALMLTMLWAGTGNFSDTSVGAPANASCILTPQFALQESGVSVPAGEVAQINAIVGGRQAAECGPMLYGVDFTNAYDASKFYLGAGGAGDKRNVFILNPGEIRVFKLYAGVVPGTAPKNYTLQVTAYSESDHWKQISRNVSLSVSPMRANDSYWATQIYVGWNTIPYAEGVGVFGCQGITEGYVYSPSLGDFVRMVREGATFTPMGNASLPAGEKNGGMFVFSKQKCAMQSLVPPEIFGRQTIAQEKEQLLSASPKWVGLNSTQLAKSYCPGMPDALKNSPNPLPISVWNAFEQKWEKLGNSTVQSGQVLRLHERTFACNLGG